MKNTRSCANPDLSRATGHEHIDGNIRSAVGKNACNCSPINERFIDGRSATGALDAVTCAHRTLPQAQRASCSMTLWAGPHVAELEKKLDVVKSELRRGMHNLDGFREEYKAIIDEFSSPDEKHRSIRLRAERDELQALTEELAALGSQIQETLKRQRKTCDDLRALHGTVGGKPILPFGMPYALADGEHPLEGSGDPVSLVASRQAASRRVADLTPRQREIMELVLAGHPSKTIAAHLGISQRTVENHRASIMRRTGSKSLPALTRLALFAEGNRANQLLFLAGTLVAKSE